MASLFAVVATTIDHESILDSLWEKRDQANSRRDTIWDYPTVFRAEVKSYPLNSVDTNSLVYEISKDWDDEFYD